MDEKKNKPGKSLLVQEISVDDALQVLRQDTDNKKRKWKKVYTMVRDPNDLTRIVSITMHESS